MGSQVILTRGLAGFDGESSGYMLAVPHTRKGAFERQLRKSGWIDQAPHGFWCAGPAAPRWLPPATPPASVISGAITQVFVARSTIDDQILWVHWGNNPKAAQIAVERLGYRIVKRALDSVRDAIRSFFD